MVAPLLFALAVTATTAGTWRPIGRGLELGTVPARAGTTDAGILEVVRADPRRVHAAVHSPATDQGAPCTAAAWAAQRAAVMAQVEAGVGVGVPDVVVVTNAGMFDTDHRTHTGYLSVKGRELTPRWNKAYQSVFVFEPRVDEPPFMRLLDRDNPADAPHLERFHGRVQNLRLIAAPRKNKWKNNGRAWSEAALASDSAGRILIVFAREPHQMVDFAARIIAQLDVVAAQHLEGGPEASLTIRAPGLTIDRAGSFETGFFDDSNHVQWPLPNLLVLTARALPGNPPTAVPGEPR